MRNRLLTILAVSVLVIVAPWAFWPLLAGAVVARVIRRSRERREQRRREQASGDRPLSRRERRRQARENRRRAVQARRDQAVEYSPKYGWNVDLLPSDMSASFMEGQKGNAYFRCAGIDDLVTGTPLGKDVNYSFKLTDMTKLDELKRKAGMYNGAAAVEMRSGDWMVRASNAAAINELAKAAFPQRTHDVTREVMHTRQYRIEGMKSYDEALAYFKAKRDELIPANSFVTVRDVVDGETMRTSNGTELSPVSLPVGTFIISETETDRYKGEVKLHDNRFRDRDEMLEAARQSFSAGESTRLPGSVPGELSVSDSTPERVERYLSDEYGNHVGLVSPDGPDYKALRAYVICEDVDALAQVLNAGELPEGALVVASREAPSVREGQFYVELERSGDVRSLLGIQGEASPGFAAKCESLGIGAEQRDASLLMDEVARNGYASCVLKGKVGLERANVNGVPVRDIADRLSSTRLDRLDREAAGTWIRDASRIQAVSVTVDPKRAELRITSVVGDVQKVETRKMTDREVTEFSRRGKVSRAEMKDLLMQVHPDYFRSYSVVGKGTYHGLYEDPVRDFLAGRRPASVPEVKARMQEARRERQALRKAAEPKRKAAPRKGTGPKVG